MLTFLVLGISNGGLFMARQLRREYPDAKIYTIGAPHDIGQYSNSINAFYAASNESEIVASIYSVIRSAKDIPLKVFMCSNPMLECVVLHHPELFETLEFENSIELYRKIVDKVEVDKLCRDLNIPRPLEYCLKDVDFSALSFPVVVKPLVKADAVGASKCAYIETTKEFSDYLAKMDGLNIDRSQLICQQCVVGDNRWEYGYGGFFKNGKPLVDIYFHQFIQVPQGLCCYSREITDSILKKKIQEIVKPFLDETQYNGFLEFDLKQDTNTKKLYLLDINPRPWRSVDMLKGKLGDSTVFHPVISNEKVVWRYRYRELFRQKNSNNVSYSICKSIANDRMKTQSALYDIQDCKPYLIQWKRDIIELIRKVIK